MIVSLLSKMVLVLVNIDQYWLKYLVAAWGCTLKESSACTTCEQSGTKAARLQYSSQLFFVCRPWVMRAQIKPDTVGHADEVTNEDWGGHEIMRPRLKESLRGRCLSSLGTLWKSHDLGLLIRPLISIHKNCQCLMICRCSTFRQMGGNKVGEIPCSFYHMQYFW